MVNETLPRPSQDWTKQIGSHSSGFDEVRSGDTEISKVMSRIEGMLSKMLAEKHSREIDDFFRKGSSSPPPTPDPPDSFRTRQISAPSPGLCAHRPQQIHQGGQIYPRNHVTRLSKMEIPKFDGTRMREWVAFCEEFFYLNKTVPELMVREASLHFEGKALQWHHDYIRNRYGLYPLWSEYMIDMSARFGWDADMVDCNRRVGSCTLSDETGWNVQMIDGLKEYGVVYTPMGIDDNQMVAKATPGRVAHQVLDEMSAQSESNEIMVNAHLNEVLELDVSHVNKAVKRDEMDEFSSLDECHSTMHKDSSKVVEISKQIEELAQKQEVEEIVQIEIKSALIFAETRSDLAAQQVFSKLSVPMEISKVPEFNVLLNQSEEVKHAEMNRAPSVARKHLNTVASQPFDERSKLTEKEADSIIADDKVARNAQDLCFDPGGVYLMGLMVCSNGLLGILLKSRGDGSTLARELVGSVPRHMLIQMTGPVGSMNEEEEHPQAGNKNELIAIRVGLIDSLQLHPVFDPGTIDKRVPCGFDFRKLKLSWVEQHWQIEVETTYAFDPGGNRSRIANKLCLRRLLLQSITAAFLLILEDKDPSRREYCDRVADIEKNMSRCVFAKLRVDVGNIMWAYYTLLAYTSWQGIGKVTGIDKVIESVARLLESSQDVAEHVEFLTFDPGGSLLVSKAHCLSIIIVVFIATSLVANFKGVRVCIIAHIASPCTVQLLLHASITAAANSDAQQSDFDPKGALSFVNISLGMPHTNWLREFINPLLIAWEKRDQHRIDGEYIEAHMASAWDGELMMTKKGDFSLVLYDKEPCDARQEIDGQLKYGREFMVDEATEAGVRITSRLLIVMLTDTSTDFWLPQALGIACTRAMDVTTFVFDPGGECLKFADKVIDTSCRFKPIKFRSLRTRIISTREICNRDFVFTYVMGLFKYFV